MDEIRGEKRMRTRALLGVAVGRRRVSTARGVEVEVRTRADYVVWSPVVQTVVVVGEDMVFG